MSEHLRLFIGYDPRQPLAYNVMAHSVASRLSVPLSITRLQLTQLPITRMGLTEFTYSRFLCPWLCGFDGYSLFLDADMVALADVSTILQGIDRMADVSVVMHEAAFERPSLMLFNNKRCQVLTPDYVQDPAHPLFDLAWAARVGGLHKDWNHVVGYNPPNGNAKIVHFTRGIPCWEETDGCEHAREWHLLHEWTNATCSFDDLMGKSVHVRRVGAQT